jgi:hypothetical protein
MRPENTLGPAVKVADVVEVELDTESRTVAAGHDG